MCQFKDFKNKQTKYNLLITKHYIRNIHYIAVKYTIIYSYTISYTSEK